MGLNRAASTVRWRTALCGAVPTATTRAAAARAECNEPLRPADAAAVAGRAPERILTTHDAFSERPGCGRVYWDGSHAGRIRRFVDELLAAA